MALYSYGYIVVALCRYGYFYSSLKHRFCYFFLLNL